MSARIAAQGTQDSGEVTVQVIDRGTGLCELQFTLLQVCAMRTLREPGTIGAPQWKVQSCSCSTLPELQDIIGGGLLCELQLHHEHNTYDAGLCWQDIALHCRTDLCILTDHHASKVPCD